LYGFLILPCLAVPAATRAGRPNEAGHAPGALEGGHGVAHGRLADHSGNGKPQSLPNCEYVSNDGKAIFFDGIDNTCLPHWQSREVGAHGVDLHRSSGLPGSAMESVEVLAHGKGCAAWARNDARPPGGLQPAMDPGEQYDMFFNGAAPRVAGQITRSPGRLFGLRQRMVGKVHDEHRISVQRDVEKVSEHLQRFRSRHRSVRICPSSSSRTWLQCRSNGSVQLQR
jgi:hypothetical protein